MRKKVRDRPANHRRLRVEHLEDRRLLAVLTVQNDLDDTLGNLAGDGELSLREAIEIANNPGTAIDGFSSNDVADTIEFASPFFDEARTIVLADGQLDITETLTIDGPKQDVLTIDASGNDPTPKEKSGDGSRVFDIAIEGGVQERSVILENLILAGGDVAGKGGAVQSTADLQLTNVKVQSNTASYRGGGISADGNLSLIKSEVSGNQTASHNGFGGGIYVGLGSLSLHSSTISHNKTLNSRSRGGGIFVDSGAANILFSTITGNRTIGRDSDGGGIYARTGPLEIVGSTISGNSTEDELSRGGGILSLHGEISVYQSTISDNAARESEGGGIFTGNFSAISIVTIQNSIISRNTDREVSPDLPNLSGANILDFSNNLLGSTTGNNFDANTGVGNLLNVDPLLGPLADNGGATKTHALLPGSPALDAGDPSIIFDPNEFDQRGAPYSRLATGILSGIPQQRIDIGAYEAQSPPSADFVDDDHINGQDFLAWQRSFGVTENATRADGDSDGDGDVDLSDLAAWRVSYGRTEMPPPPMAALSAVSKERSARLADAVLGVELGDGQEDYEAILTEWSFMDDGELVRKLEPNIIDAPHSEVAESQPVQADSTVRKENERLVDELLKTVFE